MRNLTLVHQQSKKTRGRSCSRQATSGATRCVVEATRHLRRSGSRCLGQSLYCRPFPRCLASRVPAAVRTCWSMGKGRCKPQPKSGAAKCSTSVEGQRLGRLLASGDHVVSKDRPRGASKLSPMAVHHMRRQHHRILRRAPVRSSPPSLGRRCVRKKHRRLCRGGSRHCASFHPGGGILSAWWAEYRHKVE